MTKIEWVRNPPDNITQGITINLITGCLNGCPYCYARRLARGRLEALYLANHNIAPPFKGAIVYPHCATNGDAEYRKIEPADDSFYPRFWPERLRKVIFNLGRKPKGIFLCDMSDLFGIGIPYDWQHTIYSAIRMDSNRQHRFYLLTKQPQNLVQWSPFPPNCWVGVSVTNQRMHNEAIACLSGIKASVKFISYEPLLSEIKVEGAYDLSEIQWIIIGAQTTPLKLPRKEWVEEILIAAGQAEIPVFLKNNLRPMYSFADRPEPEFVLRQEFPR